MKMTILPEILIPQLYYVHISGPYTGQMQNDKINNFLKIIILFCKFLRRRL
jgi:hypothetical protein